MRRASSTAILATTVVLLLSLTACGDDDDSGAADTSAADTATSDTAEDGGNVVEVVLSEWIVEPTPTEATAGSVEIVAQNEGGETHELVVIKGDDPDALPVDEDGKVLEDDLAEGDFIGEIEEFDAGTEETASFDLEAGSYLLLCNITEEEDDGTVESHFQEGMVNTITVS